MNIIQPLFISPKTVMKNNVFDLNENMVGLCFKMICRDETECNFDSCVYGSGIERFIYFLLLS